MKKNAEYKLLASGNPTLNVYTWINKHILWCTLQNRALIRRACFFVENTERLIIELSLIKVLAELTENAELIVNGWHGISTFL